MKKKIIALAAALMMFMGVVSASSINGDYKGNPIVKVMSNGKQLESDEVPAMIYDGHTVVPISLLRQIGASVNWDANSYSVDVNLNESKPQNAISPSLNDIAKDAKKHNVNMVTNAAVGDENGSIITFFHKNMFKDNSISNDDFLYILQACGKTDAFRCRISDNQQQTFFIEVKYLKDFYANKITSKELQTHYSWEQQNQIQQTPISTGGSGNIPSSTSVSPVTPSAVESQIDGDFNGWEGETIFKLTNGQIWQQSSYDYTYHYAYMPKVIIYKSGSLYKMKVDGVDQDIYVTRIK